MERRYDIDWLRVIAIGFLLIYHIGIAFQPWGMMIGFIQSDEPLQETWSFLALLNIWRIPFLFFVSGMGVAFALRKRKLKELFLERSKRILIPFVFGVLCISPVHIYLFQRYYELPVSYIPNAGHLWFLGNIFTYVLLLLPVFYLVQKEGAFSKKLKSVFGSPFGLLLVIGALISEVMIVKPGIFELYAQTWHGYFLGFLAFFFGYCFIVAGDRFWNMLTTWRFVFLVGAIALYITRLLYFNLKAADPLMSLESNLWVFTLLAFGKRYLNKPSKTLSYLSRGAYPIYIVHMIFLYWASAIFFKTDLQVTFQLALTILFTFGGCFITYEVIRRVKYVRLLFGLKA